MNVLSASLVIFLLFDQLLALATPFSSGFGLLLFIATLAVSAIPKLINCKNLFYSYKSNIKHSNSLLLLVSAWSIIGTANAPCHGYWFFSLATTLFLVFSWKFIQIYVSHLQFEQIIVPKHALIGLISIYFCLILAANGLDLYSILQGAPTNRPSGLYLEPSHLILYASPLIFTVIHSQQTRVFGVLLTVFIFVLAFTITNIALSSLIMLCYLIHYLLAKRKFANTKNLLPMFLAMTLFATTINPLYITSRLGLNYQKINVATEYGTRNFSTLVYLNGWLLAKSTIQNTSGMGLGLGSMGCSDVINNNKQTLSAEVKTYKGNVERKVIGVRDGSFLVSKIISELGLLGIFLIGFVVFKLSLIWLKLLIYEFDLIVTGSICLILILFFIRGLPYFSAPVMFCLITIIHNMKIQKAHKVNQTLK